MKQVSGAYDPDILAIVQELKTYRMMMGISIKELAKRIGIGDMVLGRWEKLGTADHRARMPDMINLRIWAEGLGYKIKVTIEVPGE